MDKDGNTKSVKDVLDNGIGEGNTTDLTDIENRVTTNEADITDLQEQTSDLQEQIDNLDIPEDVDLTEINDKLTQLETNQIKKSYITRLATSGTSYFKIKPCEQNTFSKILITDVYGGCILITGSLMNDNSTCSFKVVRLSNGSWLNSLPSNNTLNKILNVYSDGSYIYLTVASYVNLYIEGGYTNIETIDSIPSEATQLPILDLTQQTDLTDINTKLTQLENKANFIPVVADSPTTSYDLNDYKENGNYGINTASDYANTPVTLSGLLTVMRANAYRLQLYTVTCNNDVYFRKSADWGTIWSSWALLNGEVDLTPINAKLIQLENTINEVGGGGIYTSGEVEVGKWINGQTLYRTTLAANKSMTITSTSQGEFETLILGNINPSKYRVVKMEGSFKYKVNNSNSKTCVLPCAFADNDMVMNMVHSSTTGDVVLQGKNMPVCDITDIYVSIYYYKN